MWKRTIKPDDWCKKYHLFYYFPYVKWHNNWTHFSRSQFYNFQFTRHFLIILSKKAQNLRNGDRRLLKNSSSKFSSPHCDIMIIIITLRVEVITLLFEETRWCGFYSSFFLLHYEGLWCFHRDIWSTIDNSWKGRMIFQFDSGPHFLSWISGAVPFNR